MKVLLSNSYYLNRHPNMQHQPYLYPPLGPLYIAAYIKHNSPWDVEVFDCTFARGEADYATALQKRCPSIVGIQSAISTRITAKNMIKIAKQAGTMVVVGGPDPTVAPFDYLEWGADFVVMGEGEVTVNQLLSHLASDDLSAARTVRGISYREGSSFIANPPQPLIEDLDQIPYPAFDLIDVDLYLDLWRRHHGYAALHIITSRGCPFTCTWCSRAVFGRSFRQRSVTNVVGEMVYLRNSYGIEEFWIADDTFGLNQRWLDAWCEEVVNRGVQTPFKCMTRIDLVTSEMLQKLKRAGCYQINLGVESGSQRILDAMQKRTKVSQIRKASKMIHDADIELGYFIMFGYPGETFEDIRQTERLIFEMKPNSVGYSIAYPVPGTDFYENVKDRLIIKNRDILWERTMGGLQLLFRSQYPLIYYRALVRYLESRQRFWFARWPSANKLTSLASMLTGNLCRWIIERVWSAVQRIRGLKNIPIYRKVRSACDGS